MSLHAEIGGLLAELREEATLTQKQLAELSGLNQSRISRIEQGESGTELADYEQILRAINTPKSIGFIEVLRVEWRHLARPSLRHPDLLILIEAETALQKLDTFRADPSTPQVLAGQADLLYRRLLEFGESLLSLDHSIVYVGEIGVGKTTAVCRQSNLVLDTSTAQDLKGMLLDTGGGRTTLCEVVVQHGNRFSIQVDPLPDEEVYRLVTELCRAVLERQSAGGAAPSSTPDFKPPEEVERALRNMAGLPRPARRKDGGIVVDPAVELSKSYSSLEEFKAEFAARLTLWRRTRRSAEFEGLDEKAGRLWLRNTFTDINNGRQADFTLPGRITVTIPFRPVPDTPFEISLVDTRGVDGSAIRPDIVSRLKDKRALSVLCSKWGSAPDTSLQDLLKHVVETEVDPALFSRIAIMVIARQGDALSMRHDSGDSAADIDEGYSIKQMQVEDAFLRVSLPSTSVHVFDAANDDPDKLRSFLISRIESLRSTQIQNARQTIGAIDEMLANVEQAQSIAALNAINKELTIFAERHTKLKGASKPLHSRLITAVRSYHARTVWAATRRSGDFWNFDVYQHLGDGAAADAKKRASEVVNGLREIIKNLLSNADYITAHGFLGQILDDVDGWEADFVRAARHHAVALVRPSLEGDSALWRACEDRYGRGGSFREEVAEFLIKWFESHANLEADFGKRIQRAWSRSVLTPLRVAAGAETREQSST